MLLEERNQKSKARTFYHQNGFQNTTLIQQKQLVLEESSYITVNTTKKQKGTYDIFDKEGNLYLKGQRLQYSNGTYRKIYKHVGAVGNFLGDVSDSEPAIKKRLTYRPRHDVFSITGLFAPAGEIFSIRISEADLNRIGQLEVAVGPVLNNGDANDIWAARDFVRMPIIGNLFILHKDLQPVDREGSDYIFYLGSFLGGPIYVKNTQESAESYTITISGAVRYGHFVLGYTSKEEFDENMKSSAPYFDMEIWQNGMLHSGPKAVLDTADYNSFYDASTYWAKVTSVSSQVPSSNPASTQVCMMYEPFIAAGAAVAFVGRGTTNSPLEWFKFTTNYKSYLQDCTGDTWGPHHEYHHHFQVNYGMTVNDDFGADTETTNNIVTLIAYSYFSKVSQRRAESNEPDGDGWNSYTSASWCVNDAINTMHAKAEGAHHLAFYSVFLHSFGQELMIKAINMEKGRTNELWYGLWTNLTELDFTYFWRNIYKTDCLPLNQTEVDKYKDKHYKNFIPIACRYQTGIGYKVKGVTNRVRTMYPFMIKHGEDKILNFNEKMVVPNGFTYTIKSVINPAHGSISKQSENVYIYKPDINNKLSGEMEFTIGLKKDDDSSFAIDDIVIYVELEQTKSIVDRDKNGDILDRTIYIYPQGVIPIDPIAEYNSNFAGSESHITIPNNVSDNSNANMIIGLGQIVQNQISVLEGKFEVDQGKYRFALKCRNHGALYFSYDGGKTYELGCTVPFECPNEDKYYIENETTVTTKEFMTSQWVYFKIVMCHKQEVYGRRLFANIGIDKYNPVGEISEKVTTLKNARSFKYEAEPVFYAKDVYPKIWTQSRKTIISNKGSLISYNYVKYPDDRFNIENLFDDDDTNIIHTNGGFVKDSNPFMIFVDLGEEIRANKMTIYGATKYNWQYQPTTFKLYAGVNKDDLKLIYEVDGASVVNYNVIAEFEEQTFRYYQLNVTNGAKGGDNRFVVFRYIEFAYQYKGTLVSLDDSRVTLYNSWKKITNSISSFGNIYSGSKGSDNKNPKVVFKFVGTGFGINAAKSPEYGTFEVYVDGRMRKSISLKGETTVSSPCVYILRNLTNREHTVTLTSTGDSYNVDSFIILDDSLENTNEDLPVEYPINQEYYNPDLEPEEPTPVPQTPTPVPQTPTPVPQTPTPVPQTPTPVPQTPTQNPEPPAQQTPTQNPEPPAQQTPTQNPEPPAQQTQTQKPEPPAQQTPTQNPEPPAQQTQTQKPEPPAQQTQTQNPEPITPAPALPFKTPEPQESEVLKPDENGNIDTNTIPSQSNKEYSSEVTTGKVSFTGSGSSNLYIEVKNDEKKVEIEETKAEFGVKLDSSSSEATVKLNQASANMNVKGSGTLTIESSETVKNIAISDVIVSHEEVLNIKVDQKLESFELNNLNMFGNSEFNMKEEKPAKVKTINVNEGANAKMINLQVTEKVNIELNAVLSLSKVDLTSVAEVTVAFSHTSNGKAPITGKLGKPPIKISLVEKQSSLAAVLDEKTFTIASAAKNDFTECELWKEAVSTEGTDFKRVECVAEGEKNALVAYASEEDDNGKSNKKNTTPIIIGVVVAIVVVIAVLVVVVIVVRKRKQNLATSDPNLITTTNNFEIDNFEL